MYEAFFGLDSRPFDLTPDPRYLFLTPSHREALSNLEYGISARTGVTVLVGEAGTGKTTLIRATLDGRDQAKTKTIYMNNPTLTRSEFLEFMAAEFQLPSQAADSKTRLLRDLEGALLEMLNADITPALIIDEAHSLPYELLEEIRLLANIDTPKVKLLPIILAGQPELAARLNDQSLRQLKQRVELRCDLRPLDLGETGAYITARVKVAGGQAPALFTREAVMMIHERSHGIPRVISVICHNALINSFAQGRKPVTTDCVLEVCRDFDLGKGGVAPEPISAPAQPVLTMGGPPRPSRSPEAVPPRIRQRDMFGDILKPKRWYSFFE
jgi:type II secretory pathway predicted ATPase ExeA